MVVLQAAGLVLLEELLGERLFRAAVGGLDLADAILRHDRGSVGSDRSAAALVVEDLELGLAGSGDESLKHGVDVAAIADGKVHVVEGAVAVHGVTSVHFEGEGLVLLV